MPRLGVIIASTRDGRVGHPVAEWFLDRARRHGQFELSTLDLKAIALPLLEEPKHPRLADYQQPRTIAWSRTVAALDAFVIVTPEYNYSSPPALVNALDHLYKEWHYKPAAFVSYGGISGGTRGVEVTKRILLALKMVPINEAVTISFVARQMDAESGRFLANDTHEAAATALLDELLRWSEALRVMRMR